MTVYLIVVATNLKRDSFNLDERLRAQSVTAIKLSEKVNTWSAIASAIVF